MEFTQQLWQFILMRFELARGDDAERGEVSATTIVWAAALVACAIAVSLILVNKIRAKAGSINL